MKNISLRRLTSLGSRGVSHIIIPVVAVMLVGVAGSYMMVSSHADRASAATATKTGGFSNEGINKAMAAKKAAIAKKGYLVVYSGQFSYHSYTVRLNNADPKTHKCGGTFATAGTISKRLTFITTKGSLYPPSIIACSPIGNGGSYDVTFYTDKYASKGATGPVTVNVDGGYCTVVHSDPSLTRKVAISDEGKCYGGDRDADQPVKSNVTVTVLPAFKKAAAGSISGASIGGYVTVSIPGTDIERDHCAGQLSVAFAAPDFPTDTRTVALKYVKPKTGNSYCAAVLSLPGAKIANYTITATEAGTRYFNAATGTATFAMHK